MKKMTLTLFAALASMSFQAQQIVDFESFPLSQADTFYNGSDGAGGFTLTAGTTNVHFENYYDSQWASWSGYSVSNMTDVTTPGYQNQFSAITGSGYNSANYSVLYFNGEINFGRYVQLDSMKFTNTTYAALSMINGDQYAKVFGSPNGADGNPDGTNGEDFFRVWIYALDENNQLLDSMVFYLADFRFADNSLDYIVQTWQNLDLSQLQPAFKLNFNYECSDMSFGFINQPTYLAIDDLSFTPTLSTDEMALDPFQVYPNPVQNELYITGSSGEISLTDLSGKLILQSHHQGFSKLDLSALSQGSYLLTIQSGDASYTQTLVK